MSEKIIHQVGDVFTPSSVAKLTFVERRAINDRLVDALTTRGKQLVVYGHSGCGKTTLLENKLNQLYELHVRTPCMKGMTFEQILADPLQRLNAMYRGEVQQKEIRKSSATIGSGSFIPFNAKLSGELQTERQGKDMPIVEAGPTPQTVAEVLGSRGACWVLEDFHKIDAAEKTKLAQCMKMFMDMSADFPSLKMIFIGAVNTGREVIQFDAELRHRVSEINVPLMFDSEIKQILSLGETHLNIELDFRITDGVVALSSGLAAVAHQLALHFCRVRGIENTQKIKQTLNTARWGDAVKRYLQDSSDTLKTAFDKSLNNMKKRKYDHGRIILGALTNLPQEGASQIDILYKIRESINQYPAASLGKNLKMLQSEARGGIISFDETSGNFSFSEPVHRAFCQSLLEVESRQVKNNKAESFDSILKKLIPEFAEFLAAKQLKRNGH